MSNEASVTTEDLFDLPHPNSQLRAPGVADRWFVTEFFTSGQGQKVATIRTIDGKHFATVAVEPVTYKVPDGDGVERERITPSLAQATNVERGGRAAAQARFDEHHAIWQQRELARRNAREAAESGDAAAAVKAQADVREHDKAMKAHCDRTGLRLHHV